MRYKILSKGKNNKGIRVDYFDARNDDEAYILMKSSNPSRSIFRIICIDTL